MENFSPIILECELKLMELNDKLNTFEGKTNLKKLTKDEAAIITEISITLYFMMDKFPIIVLEELNTEELERVNMVQAKINSMQLRIREVMGFVEK